LRVIIDHHEGTSFSGIGGNGVVFSPDGQRTAYIALNQNTQCLVCDYMISGSFAAHLEGTPIFSPDSKRVAYGAMRNGKWFVVLDGAELPSFDQILGLAFSPDSRHIAYCAQRGNDAFLIVDEEHLYQCEGRLAIPSFSADSSRIACYESNSSGQRVVVNGKAGDFYPALLQGFAFSADSQEFAYGVHFGETQGVVQNNYKHRRYRGIPGRLLFSHDSRHLLYAANEGARQFMVLDHSPCRIFDNIVIGGNDVFSPDDDRFAYVARKGAYQHVIVDEELGPPFDGIAAPSVNFSSDGQQFGYIGVSGSTGFPVVGENVLRGHTDPSFLTFMPGTRYVVFTSRDRQEPVETIFVNEKPVLECDRVLMPDPFASEVRVCFDSPVAFHLIALIGGVVYSVDVAAE
jgi:hypothetical protein